MKISIITINYNNKAGLKQTLESIKKQTVKPFEYIVIDGGSTDGSANLLAEYNCIISASVSEKDSGIYNAMNKGTKLAIGDYLLFLNSGDYLYDANVLEILSKLDVTEDIIVGKILDLAVGKTNVLAEPPYSLKYFFSNTFPHPSTLIKREILLANPYDESLKIVSGWKFFLEEMVWNNRSYKIIETVISCFAPGGISSTNLTLCNLERERVLRKLLPNRVYIDYYQSLNGNYDPNDQYDAFYAELKKYNLRKPIYFISVFLMRCLSLFKKSACFSCRYPLIIK